MADRYHPSSTMNVCVDVPSFTISKNGLFAGEIIDANEVTKIKFTTKNGSSKIVVVSIDVTGFEIHLVQKEHVLDVSGAAGVEQSDARE
jgi:hypothetical protein